MGFFKAMFVIVIVILGFMLLAAAISEVQYSYKVNREMNENNATCYWDRGWFNIPMAKICTYNNTIIIKKENETMSMPNLSWFKGN